MAAFDLRVGVDCRNRAASVAVLDGRECAAVDPWVLVPTDPPKWRSYVLVVVAAYILTLGFGTLLTPLRDNLENIVFDQYQRWKPRPYSFDQPVRIVDIDDESIHLIGRWPWPRQTMAELVETLAKAGVAAIGLDVLFSEKDRPSGDVKACAAGAARSADATSRCWNAPTATWPSPMRSRVARLCLAWPSPRPTMAPRRASRQGWLLLHRRPAQSVPRQVQRRARADPRAVGKRDGLGFLNWLPDNDRVVRRVPLLLDVNGQIQPISGAGDAARR